MPLIDIHTLLLNSTVKHLNCPYCGSDMEVKKEKQKMGIWCRLMLRTPNIKQYYHCPTCEHNYGLVELGGR